MVNQPKKPTPFAKFLGIHKLGSFDQEKKEYTLKVSPNKKMVNFFPTLHGGYLSALFDDFFGMLVYFMYGINTATTKKTIVEYERMIRIRQREPLIFLVYFIEENNGVIFMKGEVKRGEQIMATTESQWRLRKNR